MQGHDLVCPRRATKKTLSGLQQSPCGDDGILATARAARAGFEGGVEGGVPPHKGGPQAGTAVFSSQFLVFGEPRSNAALGMQDGGGNGSPEPP